MSNFVPITAAHGWFQGEDQGFTIPIVDAAGAPVNISTFTLLWQLYVDGVLMLSKVGSAVTVNGTSDGFRWTVADTDTISVAPAVVIPDGLHYHEGWKTNEGDEQMLFYGDARLLPARRRQQA